MSSLPLIAYAAGVIRLAALLAALWANARRRIPGRHRAAGQSTAQQVAATVTAAAAHEPITEVLEFLQQLHDDAPAAPLAPPMYPPIGDRYAHQAGVGRYAHLRQADLDTTNDRLIRLRERRLGPAPTVDLQALRVRASTYTVGEVDDDWYAAVTS